MPEISEVQNYMSLAQKRDDYIKAFNASRVKYIKIRKLVELVSIDYINGDCERALVRAALEHLQEIEFHIKEQARQARSYQQKLTQLGCTKPAQAPSSSKQPPKAKLASRHFELYTYRHAALV